MRTSSYTIYVDLPDSSDQMLVVHGYSGAYDRASKPVAAYLRSQEVGRPPKPLYGEWSDEAIPEAPSQPPSEETLEVLKRRGYLTEKTTEEEEEFFAGAATKLHHIAVRRLPNYIFMPTYDCNLRCSYCFQDHFRTNPAFKHLLHHMKPEVLDRIFTAIPGIESAHGIPDRLRAKRQVIFFGGEPLLESSRPAVEGIMEGIREMGEGDFLAVSNCTQLEAYEDLLGPEGINFIQVTLDGSPGEHDKRRIYPDGSGSYDAIARNITMALDRGTTIKVRMNIDRNNVDDLPGLAEEMIRQGWDQYPNFSTYTAPIHAANDKTDRKTTMSSWQLDQALDRMREEVPAMSLIGRPDDGLTDRVRQIFDENKDPLPNFKSSFCGAHDRMYIFDPFGDVYACWERTGDPQVCIGRVDETGTFEPNEEMKQLWRHRTVTSNPVCRKCRYALYCGGGCAVLAEGATGRINMNYCDGFRSRFRAATAEAYIHHLNGDARPQAQDRICDL